MEGSRNPLIKKITEMTMAKIREQIIIETKEYNVIYEEVQDAIKIALDSGDRKA